LLSGIVSDGLAATLSGQRLGHLVGGDRFTVLDACTDNLCCTPGRWPLVSQWMRSVRHHTG
jgi:hypothetical protein